MPLGEKYADWDACKSDGKSDKYCGFLYHNASPHADEKALESSYQRFITQQLNAVRKLYGKESDDWDVGLMYGIPEKIEADGKKIKGTLAYAGVSRNGRLYLPEELKKGHGKKLDLILNHGTTDGAESELYRLPPEFRTALEQHKKIKIGEILLTWSDETLTLSYEAVITHEFFQKEVIEANMSVSLGILYDADSPKICNEHCYTVIKGTEFQEVSLVYHPGFPIATIEAAEAFLKKESTEAFQINTEVKKGDQYTWTANENQIPATITFGTGGTQFTFTGTFDGSSTTGTENFRISTSNGTADLDIIPSTNQKSGNNPHINVNTYKLKNGKKASMPSKKRANEQAEDQVEPTGTIPANKPTTVPDNTSGTAGGGNCLDGKIWDAETEECIDSETGDASVRSIPEPVEKASVTSTGEAETVAGVKYTPIAGSGAPDDSTGSKDEPVKKEEDLAPSDAPFSKKPETAATEMEDDEEHEKDKEDKSFDFGDLKSEKKRTQEYLNKLEQLEAVNQLKIHESRVRAKELKAREMKAEQTIRSAKESARKQLSVTRSGATESAGKISATEAEITKPAAWWKAVVAQENVIPSFIWKVDKEKIYETYGKKYMRAWDANENELKLPIPKATGTEAVTGPPSGDTQRIMSELVLVLPSGKVVTPIRQFCETKILPPGTREAFFYDFGAISFAAIVEDGSTQVPEQAIVVRSAGTNAAPRGKRLTIGYTQLEESPIDIISAANRAYALESINDESVEILDTTFDDDTAGSGTATVRKAKGGGIKDNRWVSGNTGAQITADATGNGLLTFAGLKAAKGVIQDEGLDDSNLIFYTTGKGIRDIIDDANLDTYIGYSRPAVITEATVERIAGCNLVRTSATAPTTQAVAGDSRSVLFIPNVAFGLISGRDLTMEAQRRNELQSVFLTGTQRIAGVVKNVEGTVRVSHL